MTAADAKRTPTHACRTIECWRSHDDLCLRPRLPLDLGRSCSEPLHHRGDHDYTIRMAPKISAASPVVYLWAVAGAAVALALPQLLPGGGS